jgi:DNA-binding NarL/FixJ family response regulator
LSFEFSSPEPAPCERMTCMNEDDPKMRDEVNLQTDVGTRKALVLVKEPAAAAPLIQRLIKSGFIVDISSDPTLSLDECRRNKPDLAVVEEDLQTMSGIHFIFDLLKVSWTTATIIVSKRVDEAIHEATEGLGILGHIKDYEDLESLERLLKKFGEIMSPARDTAS